MATVDIGHQLPDHVFEDLERHPVTLSKLLAGNTIITFISPTCPSCESQLEEISGAINNRDDWKYFVIVSSGNPRRLEDYREKFGLKMPLLYDHLGQYWEQLNILTYPLHVFTDKDLIISDIIVGELGRGEFEAVIESNGKR